MNRVGIPTPQINNHRVVFVCGTDQVVFPAPDFDNQENFEFLRVNRRSRGGDLEIFRADYWPKNRVLVMSWSTLDYRMRKTMQDFVVRNLGLEVIVYSYDDQIYVGVIRTPEAEFTEPTSGLHALKLEFETEDI